MQRACNKLFSTRVILCGPIIDQSLFITRTQFLYILAAWGQYVAITAVVGFSPRTLVIQTFPAPLFKVNASL